MRAATGRELIVKVEGSYHGSPDGLAWSYWPDVAQAGPPDRPAPVPNTAGVARAYGEALRIVPYNDLAALERVLDEDGERVAGMILEPVLMNVGVILPAEGYLEGLASGCTATAPSSRSTRSRPARRSPSAAPPSATA